MRFIQAKTTDLVGGTGILPVTIGRTVPTLTVRYGADYPNPGYEAKNQSLSAPKAPLATAPKSLLRSPYSLLPTPYSLFPFPFAICINSLS
ncbi:MAG: hypothetical protein F6K26_32690 [Moorea sp. SIO2I5]|nr:hypothetical protein [Moorena sp. SIO2I5]